MTQVQWITFLMELEKLNFRDALIAKIALQGGKRINEALSLVVEQINWSKNEITFIQSKTKGLYKSSRADNASKKISLVS